jgi:hypothetical protein
LRRHLTPTITAARTHLPEPRQRPEAADVIRVRQDLTPLDENVRARAIAIVFDRLAGARRAAPG